MIEPGVFGQYQAANTRIMPPALYRAMLLQGAMLGATVYQFEPFWDLFDYDNSQCWREHIYPTLMEIIRNKMIPAREQVREKMKVAYQYRAAQDINEFHENLRDVDWIHDEGLLARAAYGLWERFLEHELVPKKSRYFFIPLLSPQAPKRIVQQFERVIYPGERGSADAYEALLNEHYPETDTGTAFVAEINGHTYVMHTHANLYERQTYKIRVPRAVRGLEAAWTGGGLRLRWVHDEIYERYEIHRRLEEAGEFEVIDSTIQPEYVDIHAERGLAYVYAVTAQTKGRETLEGAVNYLDFLVFGHARSRIVEHARVGADGLCDTVKVAPPKDTRPAEQTVFPTFDGVDEARMPAAREIVARIEEFRAAYNAGDWKRLHALYSRRYQDPNGYGHEYAGRAWKWWFFRNNSFCFLRQIRRWEMDGCAGQGPVRVRMFALCRALRRDDQPFGSGYDGTLRIPRTADEEVVFSWRREEDGVWRIVATDPALPNFQEMLWNSRGADDLRVKLSPGKDGEPEYHETASLKNTIPVEENWLPSQ